jgi:ABC-type uncharacterized transport system ATPase subunit
MSAPLSVSRIRPRAPMAPPVTSTALAARGLSKRFGPLVALEDVSLELRVGQVHCLLGENGAGKSTLCNLLFGVHQADAGQLELFGEPFQPKHPAHALAQGVAMVHQHFSLVGNMTALENLALGRSARGLSSSQLLRRSGEVCGRFGFELPLDRVIEQLSVGERQRVELLKCLLEGPRLLVLDEPTAVLPPREVQALLRICESVAEQGCSVLLVTHKLAEIEAVADHVTVLRRGRVVASAALADTSLEALVRAMVGRDVSPLATSLPPRKPVAASAEPALRVEELRYVDDAGVERLSLSFDVRPGEIVGIAGVEGNGQSELCALLSGMQEPSAGRISLAGNDVTRAPPQRLRELGAGCIPEDRHAVGCHLQLSVAENLFLSELGRFTRWGLLSAERLRREAEPRLREFDVRGEASSLLSQLSGGNQQKVVLARELSLRPLRFLLAAQPTRGLDIGAVEAVYTALRSACSEGVAVLLVSSELSELLAVADRVLVLYRGRVVGELPGGSEQQEAVGRLMSGQPPAAVLPGAAA